MLPLSVSPLHKATPQPALRSSLDVWDTSRFTKPTEGVAKDYVFLVHGDSTPELVQTLLKSGGELGHRNVRYTSVIADRPGNRQTFGDIGYILSVEPSNVVGTSNIDTATQFSPSASPATVAAEARSTYPPANPGFGARFRPHPPGYLHVPDSPRELLDKSTEMNEVLVLGASAEGAIARVTGVFVRTDGNRHGRDLADPGKVAFFTAAAKELGVPMVRIPAYKNDYLPRNPKPVDANAPLDLSEASKRLEQYAPRISSHDEAEAALIAARQQTDRARAAAALAPADSVDEVVFYNTPHRNKPNTIARDALFDVQLILDDRFADVEPMNTVSVRMAEQMTSDEIVALVKNPTIRLDAAIKDKLGLADDAARVLEDALNDYQEAATNLRSDVRMAETKELGAYVELQAREFVDAAAKVLSDPDATYGQLRDVAHMSWRLGGLSGLPAFEARERGGSEPREGLHRTVLRNFFPRQVVEDAVRIGDAIIEELATRSDSGVR